jgi:hypothetical protein
VSKIVLFLADGTTLDIRLAKERLTIGRRPDNDVCLPHPAVSAEHAAVVTILDDSFLEDLGSTNCTYVNGKPVTKHFLRDRDIIEIGRQRLTYMVDDAARVDPLPHSVVGQMGQDLGERVDAVQVRRAPPNPAPISASGNGKEFALARDSLSGTTRSDTSSSATDPGAKTTSGVASAAADSRESRASATGKQGAPLRARRTDDPSARMGQVDTLQMPFAGVRRASVPSSPAAPPSSRPLPEVRVMSGPNAGRSMTLQADEMSVGRVGIQVAMIRRVGEGYRLVPVEGRETPKLNGLNIMADGAPLAIGDTFEVAGVQLTLALPTPPSPTGDV